MFIDDFEQVPGTILVNLLPFLKVYLSVRIPVKKAKVIGSLAKYFNTVFAYM